MAFDTTVHPPGVWIDEITATGPIAGTGTSTPAMIGTVPFVKAELADEPVVTITSWTDFVTFFGDPSKTSFDDKVKSVYDKKMTLPFAVRGFFQNGGTFAYIVPCPDNSKLGTGGTGDPLASLEAFTDVTMVCLPQVVDPDLQNLVIKHCETLGDRVAILDGAQDDNPADTKGTLRTQRGKLTASAFAALYWPWINIPDPTVAAQPGQSATLMAIAPSGHVAGLIARTDSQRGVHKAPANEPVVGASSLTFNLSNSQHAILNNAPLQINALRVFPGRSQPLVWGARTLSNDTAWLHLNVRRLMCFIEDSIAVGTSWAVFEPNNMALWKRLELAISEFLTRVWKSGALFGATPDEAFYVRIDAELNPPSTRALGQIFAEIGVVPVHPAEYVVFRIGMWDGGAQITEP